MLKERMPVPRFCKGCGHDIAYAPTGETGRGVCAECGREFIAHNPDTFRTGRVGRAGLIVLVVLLALGWLSASCVIAGLF
jgi:hypothetical protein